MKAEIEIECERPDIVVKALEPETEGTKKFTVKLENVQVTINKNEYLAFVIEIEQTEKPIESFAENRFDTKVVTRGSADKIFINTAGIGIIENNISITPENIKVGDHIIINGSIAEHGIAILSQRKEFNFKTNIILEKLEYNIQNIPKNIFQTGSTNNVKNIIIMIIYPSRLLRKLYK